jgi:hypothetical protein
MERSHEDRDGISPFRYGNSGWPIPLQVNGLSGVALREKRACTVLGSLVYPQLGYAPY